jgi:hypothetical protein
VEPDDTVIDIGLDITLVLIVPLAKLELLKSKDVALRVIVSALPDTDAVIGIICGDAGTEDQELSPRKYVDALGVPDADNCGIPTALWLTPIVCKFVLR